MRIAAPPQFAAAAVARGISGLIGDYTYLVGVKRDHEQLQFENSRLKARLRQLQGLELENRRLNRLLGLRDVLAMQATSASVIAKDTTEYFRVWQVTLDQSTAEVRVNMPVIAASGVVGTIRRVAGGRVDVRLSVDSGFAVDVVVERTRARGFVQGVGDGSRYLVRVEYVRRDDEVDVGDVLVTSGKGCRFPEGIPVAKVTRVEKRDFGLYQRVEAEPVVDFSRLEEVLILLTEREACDEKSTVKDRPSR